MKRKFKTYNRLASEDFYDFKMDEFTSDSYKEELMEKEEPEKSLSES